ncbi:DUF6988 family protein [Pseudomonas sp. CGJS7]|uniref:DUF6988 family protein n=1 Tax=Pseudomonas sp. CGJS7 TaxID=3109348 RepID=UPI0030096C3A
MDEIFRRSELLTQNIIEVIDKPPYNSSARVAVSGNLCQISIEHACAFRLLVEGRMFASGFTVLRAQFEAAVRAVWILYCATDHQVARLVAQLADETEQAAKNLPQVQEMLDALSKAPNAHVPCAAFTEFKGSAWLALNSFTHGGIHPLSRMVEDYPLDLIAATVKISNALAMVAAMQYSILTGIDGLQKQLTPLNERFRDCFPIARSTP